MYRRSRLGNGNREPAGFTLIEVMIAASVMVLVILSSLGTLTFGYRLLENARLTTLAGQVLQSEMETLRLKNWSEIDLLPVLPDSAEFEPEIALGSASYGKFTCVRTVDTVRTGITKEITLTVTWTSMGGTPHSRKYMSYFSEDGLNDYYCRTFPLE